MYINIQANGLTLNASLRNLIEQRLINAFQSSKHHLRKINVRLTDLNGPRGGQDKCCKVHIGMIGGEDLVVENTDSQLHVAVEGAAYRAESTLLRRINKRRKRTNITS